MKHVASALLVQLALALPAAAQETATADAEAGAAVVAEVVAAAEKLLATFDESQRDALLYPFDDEKQRRNWSNLPVGMVARGGLRWGDLNDEQQQAVMGMIAATLSEEGLAQVKENMHGDELLRRGDGRRSGGPVFGEDEYFVSILGTPSKTEPWMWQFGGHHLGVNATIVGDRITLSPTLTGGQPMTYEHDGHAVQQLDAEREKAFAFVESLSPEQIKAAVFDDRRPQMEFGPGREERQPQEEGIQASALDPQQRQLLIGLIRERVGLLNKSHADAAMAEIEKTLDDTWFAWFGATDPNGAVAYRIQGPRVVIEYMPQQMGGDPAQHVHAMYRNPANDYGRQWIDADR